MISETEADGAAFAASVGVPYSTMRSYLYGNRAPSAEFLAGVFTTYGYMPSWLLTGQGPRLVGDSADERAKKAEEEFVTIPLLNGVKASAGYGSLNEPAAEYNVQGLSFSRAWLAKRGLNSQVLKVIEVKGRSMEPVLSDGDRVLIDMSDTQPRSGYVYVLRQGEELLVKYCQLQPGGVLRVTSANNQYPSYDIVLNETMDVQIVGRVVASMHEW